MYCSNCGRKVNVNAPFCPYCGARLQNVDESKLPDIGANKGTVYDDEIDDEPYINDRNSAYNTPQNTNYLPLVFIMTGVVAIVTVGALLCVTIVGNNKNELSAYNADDSTDNNYAVTETTTETTTEITTQATTEATTEAVTEAPTASATPPAPTPPPAQPVAPPVAAEPSSYEDSIRSLVTGAYSVGWFNATNNHDASYMLPYTSPDYEAYQMLGIDYWQERPSVHFNYIQNVNVCWIDRAGENSYSAYVSYDYELYNASTGKYSSNKELATATVVWTGSEYKLSAHKWMKDVPLGTMVALSDFAP